LIGIGDHLLPERDECPWAYPPDLEINAGSIEDEWTAQPYRDSGSPTRPIAPPPTRSATPEPPTIRREYAADHTYGTPISIPIRPIPLQGQPVRFIGPLQRNTLPNVGQYSDATYSENALESTSSGRNRSNPPSRTTYGSQEDVGNFADVEDNSERAPTAYQPSHTTPSHHSVGTGEDVDSESYNFYPTQGSRSESPYTGVRSHNREHVRNAVEDYERYHRQRR
jgi:hypothetical protein